MNQQYQILDTRGLRCPLPLLKAKRAISQLASGEHLMVLVTDPASQDDFKAWVDIAKHQLLSMEQIADEFHFLLQKN
ncbi:MAG: sulfurtransferase TusA family protein [Gammaproteobacteria bacterium]|nr:sulfurtransferase TusA family protein [Gammaproteobacteria bacterium]